MFTRTHKIFALIAAVWLALLGWGTSSSKGYWYAPTQDKILDLCRERVAKAAYAQNNTTGVHEICACVVQRLAQEHTPAELDKLTEADVEYFTQICLGGSADFVDKVQPAANSRWTRTEKIAFLSSCRKTIASNPEGIYGNLSAAQYCECMASRLEVQMSFAQAIATDVAQTEVLAKLAKECAGK